MADSFLRAYSGAACTYKGHKVEGCSDFFLDGCIFRHIAEGALAKVSDLYFRKVFRAMCIADKPKLLDSSVSLHRHCLTILKPPQFVTSSKI